MMNYTFIENLFNDKEIRICSNKDGDFTAPSVQDPQNRYTFYGWKQALPAIYKAGAILNSWNIQGNRFWGVWGYKMIFISPIFSRVSGSDDWVKSSEERVTEVDIMKIYDKEYVLPDADSVFLPPDYANKGWFAFSESRKQWFNVENLVHYKYAGEQFPIWDITPSNGELRIRLFYHKKSAKEARISVNFTSSFSAS